MQERTLGQIGYQDLRAALNTWRPISPLPDRFLVHESGE